MLLSITRRLDRAARSPHQVVLCIGLYLVLLAVLRGVIFTGIAEDDAEQIFYAQSWAWGYKGNQPPLFTWLVRLVESASGPGIWPVLAVKFGAFLAFYGFSYAAARRLIADPALALLAAISPAAIFYVGWDGTVNYSNSILLAAAQAATFFALIRLAENQTPRDYVLLGLAVACGFLAKYNFVLFLVPALAFAAMHPAIRHAIAEPKVAIAVLVAAALIGPHGFWAVTDPAGLATVFGAAETPWREVSDPWLGRALGLWKLATGAVALLMPLLAVLVLLFPRIFLPLGSSATTLSSAGSAYLATFMIIAVLAILISGATDIQNHWLFGLLPATLIFMTRVEAAYGTSWPHRRIAAFGCILVVFALAVPIGLGVRTLTAPDTCRKCNFFVPWSAMADTLRAEGFSHGTIIAFDYPNQISGNLRRYFPNARFASNRFSATARPPAKSPGGCVIVWNPAVKPAGYGKKAALAYANRLFDVTPDETIDIRTISAPITGSDGRSFKLNYVMYSDGNGHCR